MLAARGVQVDNLLPDPNETSRPFADPILKLAVLDQLQGSVGLPAMQFFDEYEFDNGNLARLLAVEISQEQSLAGIEALHNLTKLKVSPLPILPADQVAGPRARGVTVEEYF